MNVSFSSLAVSSGGVGTVIAFGLAFPSFPSCSSARAWTPFKVARPRARARTGTTAAIVVIVSSGLLLLLLFMLVAIVMRR